MLEALGATPEMLPSPAHSGLGVHRSRKALKLLQRGQPRTGAVNIIHTEAGQRKVSTKREVHEGTGTAALYHLSPTRGWDFTETGTDHRHTPPTFVAQTQEAKATGGHSQHCLGCGHLVSESSEQAVVGSLVRGGGWGCGVLGRVTDEEAIFFFLQPAQEFGHYQDGTCLGHQGAEAGVELKFGGPLGVWEKTE